MRRIGEVPAGRLVWLEHRSRVLARNPLGDPATRTFPVWLPPHYDQAESGYQAFPVLYSLAGYWGAGPGHVGWRSWEENLPQRLARLLQAGAMGPVIVVFPDCFTALGGNQYLNSSAIGRYADYLVRELVPFIDQNFRTLPSREHRGLFGKSSGGYGALVHGMDHPEVWGALADHSGDAYFDFLYRCDWPNTLNLLANYRPKPRQPGPPDLDWELDLRLGKGLDDGRVAHCLQALWNKDRLTGEESHALMNLGMAASYDPDPRAPNGFRLPFHAETGVLLPRRWARWLAHDPIHRVTKAKAALRSLRLLYLDCGWRDQYHIHYGARQLSLCLSRLGIPHNYEEFEGTHSGIDQRLDRSLPLLYRAIK